MLLNETDLSLISYMNSDSARITGDGGCPHCDYQCPPLYVFAASPTGTVVAPGTTGAQVSLTRSSTSTSHVTHLMLINVIASNQSVFVIILFTKELELTVQQCQTRHGN